MKKVFLILLFCTTAQSNESDIRAESFIKDTIKYITNITFPKNRNCNRLNHFMTTGSRDDNSFKAPRLAICRAKCTPPTALKGDKNNWITESHYYTYLRTLYNNLEKACEKKGVEYKYDRNSIDCEILEAHGGRLEKPSAEPEMDLSNYKNYSCDLSCWDNGKITDYNFKGHPGEKAWIDWNVIKSCRGKKQVVSLNCRYD